MARSVPPDRLAQLVSVATEVFIQQGYKRTQMADIAQALGVAKGTLYLYVESKEALFDLAIRAADGQEPLPGPATLPIPTPKAGSTLKYVRDRLARSGRLSALGAALAGKSVKRSREELEAIVRELYDVLSRNRHGIKLIDRSARDHRELAALWLEGARGGLVELLARYLAQRMERKRLRRLPDTTAAARLIIETVAFWAVHRHWDTHPQAVDDAVAKETVVRFIVDALVNP